MRRPLLICFITAIILTACSGTPTATIPDVSTTSVIQGATPTAAAPISLGNCVDARLPAPNTKAPSLFAPVSEKDHILGPNEAYVTVLVYSDFQCVSCAKLAAVLKSIQEKHPKDVRIVFRNFPLIGKYNKSALAAQAVEAADLQGKFWEMHDLLFSSQAEWQTLRPDEFQKWLVAKSDTFSMDKARFEADLTSREISASIKKAWEDGQKIQLPGVPVILVNGEIIKWQSNLLDSLESIILLAMLPEKQFSTCPPVVINLAKKYDARLETSKGEVVIRLFTGQAPNTVNNFVFLAQQGWYDNNSFLRVVPGFAARTGDPTGTGLGGPGYFIPNEINNMLRFDRAGMVGMVNSGKDTNGSQFFISLGPAPQLNNAYTIFGQVISGMDVLTKFTPRGPTAGGLQPEPDILISVKIEEK
jgi:cyclophilin family peptidyl-prolyl cis-trans isomerase/protein-disulfide isomerase